MVRTRHHYLGLNWRNVSTGSSEKNAQNVLMHRELQRWCVFCPFSSVSSLYCISLHIFLCTRFYDMVVSMQWTSFLKHYCKKIQFEKCQHNTLWEGESNCINRNM
ncbi:unnamed protein product [Spodoptera littoralis]|uniref:Uncharacterized protein n=1 Tax=Spodoptera littoralis TaxID=7109 RepID=A0A9P0N8L5_SPOLI|nr:unnamed protein product [Spodoptera littoralis]CAH1643776.1 unnamed protein product [Spodoptera littoralis]